MEDEKSVDYNDDTDLLTDFFFTNADLKVSFMITMNDADLLTDFFFTVADLKENIMIITMMLTCSQTSYSPMLILR